jgi:predicted MFS family arabinose efflux permease
VRELAGQADPKAAPRGRGFQGLRALRHRNYRFYWSGQLISLIGTWMQRVAQAWLVLVLTNDPLMLGVLASAQYGPILVFGLFGGVVADALPKLRTLIVTQAISLVLALALGILSLTGLVEVWHVVGLALLLGLTNVIDLPTRQSFFYEMVGRDDLTSAVALNSAIFHAARVVGPAIAGLTIAAVGVGAAFMLNALSYVAVVGSLLAMRSDELQPGTHRGLPRSAGAVLGSLGEGLRYIGRTRPVLISISVLGLVSTAAMNYTVVIPPLARDVLLAGPEGYGFLMAAGGFGSVLAALWIASGRPPRMIVILGGAFVLGALEMVLGASRIFPVSLLLMFGMGLGGLAMSMGTNTTIQAAVPNELRGRVMSAYTTVFGGSTPIGGLLLGGLASAVGVAEAVSIGGAVAIGVALLAGLVAWRWGLLATEPGTPDPDAATGT